MSRSTISRSSGSATSSRRRSAFAFHSSAAARSPATAYARRQPLVRRRQQPVLALDVHGLVQAATGWRPLVRSGRARRRRGRSASRRWPSACRSRRRPQVAAGVSGVDHLVDVGGAAIGLLEQLPDPHVQRGGNGLLGLGSSSDETVDWLFIGTSIGCWVGSMRCIRWCSTRPSRVTRALSRSRCRVSTARRSTGSSVASSSRISSSGAPAPAAWRRDGPARAGRGGIAGTRCCGPRTPA